MNDEAQDLLAGAILDGRLNAWRRSDQLALDLVLVKTTAGGPSSLADPIMLEKPDHGRPILAQAIPVSAALAGEPAALIVFSDPTNALELLGLTRAEARIASCVGNGLPARQAAVALSISENTVRSALQLVYEKLGIGKQSELARIVARLDGFGTPMSRTKRLQGVL
jgi:DNA-binding CsgD family transcriptional regulator